MLSEDEDFNGFNAFSSLIIADATLAYSLVCLAKLGIRSSSYLTTKEVEKFLPEDLDILALACDWIDDHFYKKSYDC